MSIPALNYVRTLALGDKSPSRKYLLTLLADRADEAYSCFPSVGLLAAEMEIQPRGVRKLLDSLRADGLISFRERTRENGSTTSNRYYLHGPWDNYRDTGQAFPEIVIPAEARRMAAERTPVDGGLRTAETPQPSVMPDSSTLSVRTPSPLSHRTAPPLSVRTPLEPPLTTTTENPAGAHLTSAVGARSVPRNAPAPERETPGGTGGVRENPADLQGSVAAGGGSGAGALRAENNKIGGMEVTAEARVLQAVEPIRPALDQMGHGQRGKALGMIAVILRTQMSPGRLAAHLSTRYAPVGGYEVDGKTPILKSPFGWLVSQLPQLTSCARCGTAVHGSPASTLAMCGLCSRRAEETADWTQEDFELEECRIAVLGRQLADTWAMADLERDYEEAHRAVASHSEAGGGVTPSMFDAA